MTVVEAPIVRAAEPGDETLLFALFCEDKAAQLAAVGLGQAQIQMLIEMQYRGRTMTYSAAYPDAMELMIVEPDSAAVGHMLLDRNPDRWRIVDIAVLAAHRGRGLGTRVLQDCKRQAAAAGAAIELQVEPYNPARRLYERLGFRATEEDVMNVKMVWDGAN